MSFRPRQLKLSRINGLELLFRMKSSIGSRWAFSAQHNQPYMTGQLLDANRQQLVDHRLRRDFLVVIEYYHGRMPETAADVFEKPLCKDGKTGHILRREMWELCPKSWSRSANGQP